MVADGFLKNLRRIGHTFVVLEWEAPLPLTRFWCIWEMYCSVSGSEEVCAVDTGAVPLLELRFPPSGVAPFHALLQREPEKLWQLLCRVDLKAADAYHGGQCRRLSGGCPAVAAGAQCPDDKARLLAAIEAAPSGVDGVTRRVVACLREWMIRTARAELATIRHADERSGSTL